jgi:hypothetical protein
MFFYSITKKQTNKNNNIKRNFINHQENCYQKSFVMIRILNIFILLKYEKKNVLALKKYKASVF